MCFKDTFRATALLLILWQTASMLLNKPFLPTPGASFVALGDLLARGLFLDAFIISSVRILASGLLALLFAVPLGLAMGRHKALNHLLSPFIAVLYPLPKVVFLPILVVFMGLGNAPKITLIALIVFFQILVVVRDAARSIPEESLLSMKSITQSRFYVFYHLIWPWCLPDLLTSLRVSVGTAIAVLFFAETFASFDGLGYLIMDGMERRNYPAMYAAIIGMALLGVILYGLTAYLERRYCQWKRRQSG